MILKLDQFRGTAPRVSAVALPDGSGQAATNCLFGSGSLRPLVGESAVTLFDTLASGTKQSIYKYTADRWMSWITDVDVCRSAVAMDAFDRRYWTGDGAPKMGDNTKILGVGAPSGVKPAGSWNLGIPAPVSAPTLSAAAASNTVDDETWAYTYTYVSAYGEEGPPYVPALGASLPTIVVTPANISVSAPVSIGSLSSSPGASYNIVSKNIYRMNTGTNATELQFVASVAVATTSYSDYITNANLGVVLPSATWIPPNSAMTGLISHPEGFLLGFYNNVLCPSEPYLPHAYPASYQKTVDAEIVALGAFGNSVLVTTKGLPYVVTGSTPGQLSVEKLEKGEPCINKRAFVDMGYTCMYPGPSGLWVAGTGSVDLATQALMTKKEWLAYSATLQFAVQYESLYIGFMTTGGFVLDTTTGDFSTHDVTATAGYYDREAGRLYLIVGGALKEWSSGTDKTLTWKSKKFQTPAPTNFGVAQVFAAGPITIKFFAESSATPYFTQIQVARSSDPFRLPSGFRATVWEIQIEGAYEVTSLYLASTISELAQV